MNQLYRIILTTCILTFTFSGFSQGLLINELMSANRDAVYDEDGETPDWIEILNNGSTSVNLSDYYLSESETDLFKWQLPDYALAPGKPFLVYASGKDRLQVPLQWNTIVDLGHTWKYLVPTAEPATTWKTYSFAETGWQSGASGIGYGDGDDKTGIASGKISVFMRKKFTITELSKIESLWLHMDYDDGFVAYLNGTEICRSGLGPAGSKVVWNQSAADHEANIYRGIDPEGFDISAFIDLLNSSENILAVQVHNAGTGSSDLSAIPILTVGYSGPVTINAPLSKYVDMPTLYPHTNFKLSSSGETVSVTHKNGVVSDSVSYGIIPAGFSYGRNKNSIAQWGYFQEPTPGAINGTAITTEVVRSEIQFSIGEMFLTAPKQLTFSGKADGEEIRYTLNSDDPDENSILYRGPIEINRNMVVRARAFRPGATPGKIVSRTYLFDTPPTLPVVAVTTDSMNLWDNETGIYILGDSYEASDPHYGANYWEDWEKPAGIEMTGTDGNRIFSLNCGIKIFGAWSRMRPQKSLSVFFRKEYGDPELEGVQLFKSKPITSFKSVVLRNAGNDYDYVRYRDGMMTDLVKDMDTDIQAFEPVIMYLNGKYWGHINLREKINENYLESNHDVDPEKVDMLEGDAVVVEGGNENYLEIIDFINKNSLTTNANYDVVANQIDISNYIDYMLSMIYFDNRDWPGNNIKYWRPQTEGGKWRWLMYDTDFGFGLYNQTAYTLNTLQFALEPNGPSWPNPPWSTLLFRKLVENVGFKNAFINRFADMMNTTFVAENVIAVIDSIAQIVEPEIPRHYQRWSMPSPGWFTSNTQVMRTFAKNRAQNVRAHITQQFTRAGIYDVFTAISPANAGSIKLNSLEIETENWTGKYFQNVPVKLSVKPAQGYKLKHWEVNGSVYNVQTMEISLTKSTTFKAVFEETISDGNSVVINEINYSSPDDKDAGDWIELFNWGRVDLDISGWVFKDSENDHQFIIPENTVLASNAFLVLCRSIADFNVVNPGISGVTGDFDFGLSGSGDAVRLFDNKGILVDSVAFGSANPWPAEPDGGGPSLEFRHYTYDNSVAENWKASTIVSGTPGAENSITVGNNSEIVVGGEKQLLVYPNPFVDETTIRLENFTAETAAIEIFTIDGKLIVTDKITGNEYVWKGENRSGHKLQPGIYFCRVKSGNNLATARIVMSH
ncbi:MAG: CotH kinase family protein [Draconibacterium sp.]